MNITAMPGAQAGTAGALSRNQKRHDETERKKRAETVRRRLGHVPSADALKRLDADLRQHRLADLGRLDQIEASGGLDGDDERRLVAYAEMVKAAAPALAEKMLDTAAHLHGADRFEIASLSPVGRRRETTSGRLPKNRNQLRDWIMRRLGYENLYLGAQKRSDGWSGTAAATGVEIADYPHLVLDFDRPAGVTMASCRTAHRGHPAVAAALEPRTAG